MMRMSGRGEDRPDVEAAAERKFPAEEGVWDRAGVLAEA